MIDLSKINDTDISYLVRIAQKVVTYLVNEGLSWLFWAMVLPLYYVVFWGWNVTNIVRFWVTITPIILALAWLHKRYINWINIRINDKKRVQH